MFRKLFIISLLTLCPVYAESYKIGLYGKELMGLSALELKLLPSPAGSLVLGDDLKIYTDGKVLSKQVDDSDLLYKFVDPQNSMIRLFFKTTFNSDNLHIEGDLERVNYSGQASISLAAVNYISDFGKDLDTTKIKSQISLLTESEILPFLGISKAKLLGPKKIIYQKDIIVSVSDVETYGFSLGAKISSAKINGIKAKIINNEIIIARIPVSEDLAGKELEVSLEVEVDNKIVTKSLGTLSIVEAVQ